MKEFPDPSEISCSVCTVDLLEVKNKKKVLFIHFLLTLGCLFDNPHFQARSITHISHFTNVVLYWGMEGKAL